MTWPAKTVAADRVPGGRMPVVVTAATGDRASFSRYATVVLLVVLIVVFSLISGRFLSIRNWQNLLVVQAVVCCTAFGPSCRWSSASSISRSAICSAF